LKAGAAVLVIDGNGTAYRGHIDRIAPRKQIVEITPYDTIRNYGEPEVIVTLGAGLSTGTKFSTIIEKGTELGVRRFVPIVCEKSKVKIDGEQKTRARGSRFERVALAAAKQCRRAYRPEISLPVSFDTFLRQTDNSELRILFDPSQPATRLEKVINGDNLCRTFYIGKNRKDARATADIEKAHAFLKILSYYLQTTAGRLVSTGPESHGRFDNNVIASPFIGR